MQGKGHSGWREWGKGRWKQGWGPGPRRGSMGSSEKRSAMSRKGFTKVPLAAKARELLAGKSLDNSCDGPGDGEAGPGAAGMPGDE